MAIRARPIDARPEVATLPAERLFYRQNAAGDLCLHGRTPATDPARISAMETLKFCAVKA